jgi:chromosome segregation protein
MHLKSISMKGFKSFPDRTTLTFGPGISVIVGPNGSGKSNITDAVLWALGEQSPLAVRGQSMQDVIFAGGHGVKGRSAAEVEVVIDNSDGRLDTDFSEISIARRIDRSGEGVYLLNGARCRLVDVQEVLSDTGLGKEMHSVISQGRVEAIIHSKPADRTMLIEEAAGLTKHRKRRHRAQLKLNRTQDNLDRALDVEREARSRLRPLKRQAEAAELHARLERQSLEARLALLADDLRAVRADLAQAEDAAGSARARRDEVDGRLMEVAHDREETERRFAERGRQRELLAGRVFAARAAVDRISLRVESAGAGVELLRGRAERSARVLEGLRSTAPAGEPASGGLAELEAELAQLESEHAARLGEALAGLEAQRAEALRRQSELDAVAAEAVAELEQAAEELSAVHARRRTADEAAHGAARAHSAATVELERVRERLRLSPHGRGEALAARLEVEPGYEAAVAAALGGVLGAHVVSSLGEGERAIAARGEEGGRALVRRRIRPAASTAPPAPGAERLADRLRAAEDVADVAEALLADAWLVDGLADLPAEFAGIAVTRDGLAFDARRGEVRRLPAGGSAHDPVSATASPSSSPRPRPRPVSSTRLGGPRPARRPPRQSWSSAARRSTRGAAMCAGRRRRPRRRRAGTPGSRSSAARTPRARRRRAAPSSRPRSPQSATSPTGSRASGPGTLPAWRHSSARWSTTAPRCPRGSGWWPRCRPPWPRPASGGRGSSTS